MCWDCRLKHAAELLSGTDRSVLAVAFESGFEDLVAFPPLFQGDAWVLAAGISRAAPSPFTQ